VPTAPYTLSDHCRSWGRERGELNRTRGQAWQLRACLCLRLLRAPGTSASESVPSDVTFTGAEGGKRER
jgi:hypothetical protein